jgi:hypothetical protein
MSEASNAPTCVIGPHDRPATHGYVCANHHERVAQWLHEIEVEAALVTPVKSMQVASGNRGAGLASERSPARLTAIAMTDPRTRQWVPDPQSRITMPAPKAIGPWCLFCDHETCTDWRAGRRRDLHDDEQDAGSASLVSILGVLESWARVVREDRALAVPEQVTVASERRTLTAQWDWICEQPWVDEFVGELRTLRLQLKACNGTQDDKPYGRCYLPAEDGPCGGPIWLDVANGHAHCGKCRQTWDGEQLAMLKWELDRAREEAARPRTQDGRRMLTAQEMANRLGIKLGAFRVRVHRNPVATVDGYYDPKDFQTRAPTSAAS